MYEINTSNLLFLESAAFVSLLFGTTCCSDDTASKEQDSNQQKYVSPIDAGLPSKELEQRT